MSGSTPSRPCHVKGSAVASRVRWVQLNHGEEGLDRVRMRVDADLAQVLCDGVANAQWYPLEAFIELNVVIDELFGDGDLGLVHTLGRHAADANLTTVFRLFLKVGTVQWILARAARIWGMHYDSGQLVVREFPGEEVEIEVVGFAAPSRVHCVSIQGWAERAAELSGAREVVLDEVDCRARGDDRCRFRLRWR